MAYQLAKPTTGSNVSSGSWQQRGWYFQAHLDQIQELLKSLKHSMYESRHGFVLIKLIADMLASTPDDRPSIDDVVCRLSSGSYVSECCIATAEGNSFSAFIKSVT